MKCLIWFPWVMALSVVSGAINAQTPQTALVALQPITESEAAAIIRAVRAQEDAREPTREDFTPGQLEYYIVQSSGIDAIDAAALQPITVMLEYYRAHLERIQRSYENAQKIRVARDAYLEANPRKQRDLIINSAPIDKRTRKTTRLTTHL